MRYFLTVLCIMLSLYSSALTDSVEVAKPKKVRHQVFANTTFFLKQIINLSNQNIAISPYIVGYKCFFKKHGIRTSVGGSFNKKTEFPDSISTLLTNNNSVDYRLGYEYQYKFGKKWTLQTGIDAVGKTNFLNVKANTHFDIVSTTTTSNSFGGGPFLGIQFNIGKRIALFTEVAFYYSYTWSKRKIDSQNFPELNTDRNNGTEHKGEFILPTSLYFAFIF